MKIFFALFKCEENGNNHNEWKKLSVAEQQEKLQAGQKLFDSWALKYQEILVMDPIRFEEKMLYIDRQGIHEKKRMMGAYTILKANSLEEAAQVFENHPHFSLFPGEGIEIIECKK